MLPSVYIESSIVSYLMARPSNNIHALSKQNATLEWWETEKTKFNCFVSEFVLNEISAGNAEAAAKRVMAITGIQELDLTADVLALGLILVKKNALPQKAQVDAYHVAFAAVYGINYLLTWNCTHIANAYMRPKIEAICRDLGYEPPVICTPTELMEFNYAR